MMMDELEGKSQDLAGDVVEPEDAGVNTYQEIDKLEAVGVNVADIKKLKAAGFYTIASIVMATSASLQQIKGMSEAKLQKIMEGVKKVCKKPQSVFIILRTLIFRHHQKSTY